MAPAVRALRVSKPVENDSPRTVRWWPGNPAQRRASLGLRLRGADPSGTGARLRGVHQKWYLTSRLAVSCVVLKEPLSSMPYLFFQ